MHFLILIVMFDICWTDESRSLSVGVHTKILNTHNGHDAVQPGCCPENTTRVVLFVPLLVAFYAAHIILNHDFNVVESYQNW